MPNYGTINACVDSQMITDKTSGHLTFLDETAMLNVGYDLLLV